MTLIDRPVEPRASRLQRCLSEDFQQQIRLLAIEVRETLHVPIELHMSQTNDYEARAVVRDCFMRSDEPKQLAQCVPEDSV